MIPRILIIAGSDSGGGAGIQADIKTVTMLGGHATTAITAITAQNTLGVEAVLMTPTSMVRKQIEVVLGDLGADAIKIGMLGSAEVIRTVEQTFEANWQGRRNVVLDPVMVAKGGQSLLDDDAVVALWSFMGSADVLTPNIPELEALIGTSVSCEQEALKAGRELAEGTGCAVVVKGGHLPGPEVVDWLIDGEQEYRFSDPRLEGRHTHGTGCTLASAIAVGLANGRALPEAVKEARRYVRSAIQNAPGFGAGHGPMGHALGRVPFDLINNIAD